MRERYIPDDEQIAVGINIQWFPGHMAKTRRIISEHLKEVDIVAEVVDARIPVSSRNPVLNELLEGKKRIILLNKSDLSDDKINRMWQEHFASMDIPAILLSCDTGKGIKEFTDKVRFMLKDKLQRDALRGMKKSLRVMIVGVPNVGKSTFINRIAGEKKAKTEDRPGVTRNKQWIRLSDGIDLLDTPGILWPKFEDQQVALNLAFTGAIKDDIYDYEAVASSLCKVLAESYPQQFCSRYKIDTPDMILDTDEPLAVIGKKRGFLISGGEIDTERAARMILDEFRGGKIGKITLERPE